LVAFFSVLVWGVPCEVVTNQKSKSVWIASGSYVGISHSLKGRTEGAAVMRWTEWARYRGEGQF
jgi:hypothetical protein